MGLNTVVKLIYSTHPNFPLLPLQHTHTHSHTHSHTHRLVSMFLFLSRCRCSPSRAPEDLSVETSTSMENRYTTSCVMAALHSHSPPPLPSTLTLFSSPPHSHSPPPLHTHPLPLLSALTLSPSSSSLHSQGIQFYTQLKTVTSLWREEDAAGTMPTVMPTMK